MSTTPQPTTGTRQATGANHTAEQLFPLGSKVLLRYSGSSEIGQVVGHKSGRVLVHWPLWARAGRYMASSLTLAEVEGTAKQEAATKPVR